MKALILITLMVSSSVYANVCDLSYTFDIDEAIEAGEIEKVKVVTKNFNKSEKALIMRTLHAILEEEAVSVSQFGDGEIQYLKDEGKNLVLVHFWPDDSESGVIFVREAQEKYKLLAVIGDSHIDCI